MQGLGEKVHLDSWTMAILPGGDGRLGQGSGRSERSISGQGGRNYTQLGGGRNVPGQGMKGTNDAGGD